MLSYCNAGKSESACPQSRKVECQSSPGRSHYNVKRERFHRRDGTNQKPCEAILDSRASADMVDDYDGSRRDTTSWGHAALSNCG